MSFEPVENRFLLENIEILQRWIPKTKTNWAKTNWGKFYRKLLNGCHLILDDEKYFKLTGDNVTGNGFFILPIYFQLLQTLNSKRKKDSKQRWWFRWPYTPKRFLISKFTEASKLFVKTHISMNVSTKDYFLLLKNTIRMETICSDLICQLLIIQILLTNVSARKVYDSFVTKIILQMCLKLV
jgi:hypothetical protein